MTRDEYQKKLDSVNDWSEAVRWVDRAVKLQAEVVASVGGHTPEACGNADVLKAAWRRILRG
jgi:hypothetical protein